MITFFKNKKYLTLAFQSNTAPTAAATTSSEETKSDDDADVSLFSVEPMPSAHVAGFQHCLTHADTSSFLKATVYWERVYCESGENEREERIKKRENTNKY